MNSLNVFRTEITNYSENFNYDIGYFNYDTVNNLNNYF